MLSKWVILDDIKQGVGSPLNTRCHYKEGLEGMGRGGEGRGGERKRKGKGRIEGSTLRRATSRARGKTVRKMVNA